MTIFPKSLRYICFVYRLLLVVVNPKLKIILVNEKKIKAFVKEIVTIIVGILIALWINNWNENRKDKKYIHHITTSINKELSETRDDIINNIATQKSLIDTLDFYKKEDKISLFDILKKVNGLIYLQSK